MRILHVIPAMTYERGGPAAVVAALSRHQCSQGHDVAVLTTDQGQRDGEQPIDLAGGVELIRTRVWGPDRCAYSRQFASEARCQLRAADVMHVHSIFRYPCWAAIRAATQFSLPVVVRPCGVLHRYGLKGRSALVKALFLRRYGAMYQHVCSAWHYTSSNERADSWPWQPSRSFVLPNGIDPEPFAIDRAAARRSVSKRWPALAEHDYVLFLGRLHAKKRVDLLLQAFLAAAPPSSKLVVAGPDEGHLWLDLQRRFLSGADQAERVVRLGLVTGAAKHELLAGARLFALASEHENFGNTVLEALAAGTPVIGTANVDLISELAAHRLATVAEMSLRSWEQQLGHCLDDHSDPTDFVGSARRFVAKHYGWEELTRRIVCEYDKLR